MRTFILENCPASSFLMLRVRHPNPVHHIQFKFDVDEGCHFIRYRYSEASDDWRPRHRLDLQSDCWEFDAALKGWRGLLKAVPFPMAIPPLAPNSNWIHESSVRKSIMSLTRDLYPRWSNEIYREWTSFWTDYHTTAPSVPFSVNALSWGASVPPVRIYTNLFLTLFY